MARDVQQYRFGDFLLDVRNRTIRQNGDPIELTARYFDALVLLVHEHGQLVEKDRLFEEVWGDVVVSDSALTQCIKDIRKQLGDDAANPRYIQTVPRYGYRFIAPVHVVAPDATADDPAIDSVEPGVSSSGSIHARSAAASLQAAALWGAAGSLGGAFAGVFGGLLYGSALAYSPTGAELGTASILLVLLSLNVLVGFIGGAGVSFGMATMSWIVSRSLRWSIVGAALGGMLVGGGAKLLGVDAFNLLFGRAPAGITGGIEGGVLGAAVATGAWLGRNGIPSWRPIAFAAAAGAIAGAVIPLAGGNLMGGSLELLGRSFDGSRLQLDALGQLFGEVHFGTTTHAVLGGIEGMLFGGCVIGAMALAKRRLTPSRSAA